MATYPTVIKAFSRRQDSRDIVVANDVNVVYDEVEEIEAQLGVGGVTTSNWSAELNTFSTNVSSWKASGGLKARLDNIEVGIRKSIAESVAISGGSLISPTSGFGLAIKAAPLVAGNAFEVRDANNNPVMGVNSAGKLSTVLIDGGTA